ncbi:MAG: protein-methionine-sulfoxide reductase heme-binding subunit MsrQ [Pseudomonadota bacterium]
MQKFIKPVVFVVCLLPALWWGYLIWLAYQGDVERLGPDPAKALSLVSGEWSIRFLVLALAITPLRYLFNVPYLWRLRRMIGLYAFFYTTLHFLVFILVLLQLNWADLGREIAERPYITLGFLAYVILFLLAITSFNYAQRKLGRNWKRLHRCVYAAAIFAVLHLVWIVRSDFGEALLYGGLVTTLLLYRMMHKLSPPVRKFSFR